MRTLWQAGDAAVAEYGQSIESDLRFWKEDVEGSIAHARMLGATAILSTADSERIVEGLEQILAEGPDELPKDVEDIHTAVEMRLHELIGDVAGKLHTARSRNDQVATDAKLYLRRRLESLGGDVKRLQAALIEIGHHHRRTLMPGYTHFQPAQPITLGFHYLAHFWAMQRCGRRLEQVQEFLSTCPLGAAALAGTGFPVDRSFTARALGFDGPVPNALDATSDRSWASDVMHMLVQLDTQLGKMANELVLWSSAEFGFVRLNDAYITGSSIMPQKRNPDIAELVRGRSSTSRGVYVQMAALVGNLPLGYHRDYQDDKPPIFAAIQRTERMLSLMTGMLESATWDLQAMRRRAAQQFSCVTELADQLAARGIPFRQAHHLTTAIVKASSPKDYPTHDAILKVMGDILTPDDIRALERAIQPQRIVAGRRSAGSTGQKPYAAQIRRARQLHAKPGFSAII